MEAKKAEREHRENLLNDKNEKPLEEFPDAFRTVEEMPLIQNEDDKAKEDELDLVFETRFSNGLFS